MIASFVSRLQSRAKVQKFLFNLFKALLLLAAFSYVVYVALHNPNFTEEFRLAVVRTVKPESLYKLLIIFLLIPVNWSWEAVKWQHLVQPIAPVRFSTALRSVLTGLAMSFVSANAFGEYLGRMWSLKAENRSKVLGAMFLNGACQTYVSYVFGGIGLLYFLAHEQLISVWISVPVWCVCVAVLLALVSYMRKLPHVAKSYPKIYHYVSVLHDYRLKDIVFIVFISMLRFFGFVLQYLLVFDVFEVSGSLGEQLSGVALIFLSKSVIPNFSFLSDLGIREFSAVFFMGRYGIAEASIISATLSVWFLNMLIPVCVGLLLSGKMKIRRPTANPNS